MRRKTISKRKLKALNKEIFDHVFSAIIFTIMLISLGIIISHKYLESNVQKVYNDNNLTIQISPRIKRTLNVLTDSEGLNSKNNVINITNNGEENRRYKIILTPISDNEEDIRVAIDNSLIRSLSNFDKEDDSYILLVNELEPGFTRIHSVKVWQDKKVENKKIKVNFKLEVKTLD